MDDIFPAIYPWVKAGHVVFMVFWLAGLFMLPRQCIYMLDAEPGSDEEAQWAYRMGLLRKIILTPSLIVVWALGLYLPLGLYLQFTRVPALLVIGSWFTLQLVYSALVPISAAMAWWTHLAGFALGLIFALLARALAQLRL